MASATSPLEPNAQVRTSTGGSDEFEDPPDALYSRFKSNFPTKRWLWLLLACRNVIGNLVGYFEQLESYQKTKSKECQKLSRTLEVTFKTPGFATDGSAKRSGKPWETTMVELTTPHKAFQMSNFHAEYANRFNSITRGILKSISLILINKDYKEVKRSENRWDKFVSPSVGAKVLTFCCRVIELKIWEMDSCCGDESYESGCPAWSIMFFVDKFDRNCIV